MNQFFVGGVREEKGWPVNQRLNGIKSTIQYTSSRREARKQAQTLNNRIVKTTEPAQQEQSQTV